MLPYQSHALAFVVYRRTLSQRCNYGALIFVNAGVIQLRSQHTECAAQKLIQPDQPDNPPNGSEGMQRWAGDSGSGCCTRYYYLPFLTPD